MTNVKRTLSALLAVVMIFTTMTIAFTVIGSAAPTVPRTPQTVLSPSVSLTVPQYLATFGTTYYEAGDNVKPEGKIQATITSTSTGTVEDISLTCSDAGVQLSPRSLASNGVASWTVQGGVLKTPAATDGTTSVKWTLSCTVSGKTYVTYAWSQVRPVFNNPGFSVRVHHKNTLSAHRTYNLHVEWIGPVIGKPATETADRYYQCWVNEGAGLHTESTASYADSYYWSWNQDSGDDETHESALWAKGTLYADLSQVSTLQDIGLASGARPHASLEEEGADDHPQFYRGTTILDQSFNGVSSNKYTVSSPSGHPQVGLGQQIGDAFSGPIPPLKVQDSVTYSGSAQIKAQIEWEGNVTVVKVLGVQATQYSYHRTKCKYQIDIVSYDKTDLWTAISNATNVNYQAAQFLNQAPEGATSKFRTWDQYLEALQNAWYIYGRQDVTQTDINNAVKLLDQASPKYNASTNAWVSGMMYAPADYSQIDSIYNTISQTLDSPDFFVKYSDGTYGKYYQYSLASLLVDALDDIKLEYNLEHDDEVEKTPLDARFQGTVDQMRTNLLNAINALIETPERQTTKLVSIEFIENQTNVTNMPSPITTSLNGLITKPAAEPKKQYYRFTGWYYDAGTTDPVDWPIQINPNDGHFKADLDVQNDNAGVAYSLYAGWDVTGATLTFDSRGGSEIAMVVGEEGAAYHGPSTTPTKTGCRFLGWYTDDTLETPVDWSTFTLGSLDVVYAKWAENSFTVTFDANGGAFSGGSTTLTVTDLYGTPVSEPTPPTQTGIGFNGWYYSTNFTSENAVDWSTFTIPSYNVTLYANWDEGVRNVIFDPQNGSGLDIRTYETGNKVFKPDDPVRDGFTFKGWYTNPKGTGSPKVFPFTIGGSNVTLYGVWTPLKFTVTFEVEEGASMPASFNAASYQNMNCGSALVAPEDPVKTDYVFDGWLLELEDGTYEPYTFTTVPPKDITLRASFVEEPYVATFHLRTDAGATVTQGDVITATVSMEANRYVTNHRFIVYYDKRYMTPYFNGKAVTGSISGSAACSKIAGKAYFTLLKDSNGQYVSGCGTPTGRVTPGNIVPALQYFPEDWVVDNRTLQAEYANYEFVYFDAPDVSTGTRIRPEGEVDIASFQFLVLEDAPLADGVANYAQLLLPADFTRTSERTSGKIAAVLQKEAAYDNAKDWDNTTNVVEGGDLRFGVEEMQTCYINFNTNGGSDVEPIARARQGGTIVLPGGTTAVPGPTRDYYKFAGWTLTNDPSDVDYVNAKAFSVPCQDSLTLYAKWTGNQVNYYVRHHKQNLTASGFLENYEQQTIKAAVGTTVTATPKTYAGFTCTNPNDTGVVRGETSNPLIIDLWYLRNNTSITLDANGGKFENNQQTMVLNGLFDSDVANIPADPTREGYIFSCWLNGNSPYTIRKYPAEDVTLTAEWTAKTITVNFYLNGSETPYDTKVGKYGDALELPEDPPVDPGYLFTGWKTADGTLISSAPTFPAEDTDFYGAVDIDGYRLTLVVNGTQYGDPIEVFNGTQVTEESLSYTPNPGFRFTGWRVANSRDSELAEFPMTLSENKTLYGFTERETYSITTITYIDGELNEELLAASGIFYGASFELPEPDDYTDYGYGFRGWYIDPEMTTLYVKPATMPAENLVLYGEYYEMTGTITFDLNGGTGTAPADITQPLDVTVTLPAGTGITKQYYKFGGWSTSPTGTNAITKYTISGEETVTLYAIWTINFATISFNLNGAESGTRPDSRQVEIGETIAAADLPSGADFVKTGYYFAGWAERATATSALESYTATSTGNKILYAVWIAEKVTLIARSNSTTVIDEERGFIYGLELGLNEETLLNTYLDVIGDGYLQIVSEEPGMVGTGTVVNVINNRTGKTDATYTIVIFGDLTGDGKITNADVTEIRSANLQVITYEPGSALLYAADLTGDGRITIADVTELRNANLQTLTLPQLPIEN